MRPGPRMPLNTREGVADAPIEPGARTLCEPWDFGPAAKLWRLIVPWKPLPFDGAGDLDGLADLEGLDGDGVADRSSPASSRNSTRWRTRRRVGLLEMAELAACVSAFSRTAPKPSWTAS